MRMQMKLLHSLYTISICACLITQASATDMISGYDIAVDKNGVMSIPDVDYRNEWTMLGTWSIAGEESADGLHVVYTQPGVANEYRKTGKFPDGAVLIKDLYSTKTGEYTTGTVSYASELTGMFLMIKDTQKRFKGNPIWGSGWGWAYFDSNNPETTTTNYNIDCKGCHIPARKNDWIFIEGYPVLTK